MNKEEAQIHLNEVKTRIETCRKQIADTEDLIMNATSPEGIPWDEILELKKKDLQRLTVREAEFENILK